MLPGNGLQQDKAKNKGIKSHRCAEIKPAGRDKLIYLFPAGIDDQEGVLSREGISRKPDL
jgi:hypothetical protein